MKYKDLKSFGERKLVFGNPGDLNFGYLALPLFELEPDASFDEDYFI